MSIIDQKINKNFFYRNNKTLQKNSQSYIYKNESLPTISSSKIPKINKKYPRNNLNLLKSPTVKRSIKNVLLSPLKKNNLDQTKEINPIFLTKIIIENPPSSEEITFILENYIKITRCEFKYELFYDINYMIFTFEEEKIALDFMKLLFQEKQSNPRFQHTSINIQLSKKKNISKLPEINNKIAKGVLKRLYYGIGYEKKEKPKKKFLGNVQFTIQSPFCYKNPKKMKKNISELNSNEKNFFHKKLKDINIGNKFGFIEFNENYFKDNKKFGINLLNTTYKPLAKVIVREENKNKWMCPLDFKMY